VIVPDKILKFNEQEKYNKNIPAKFDKHAKRHNQRQCSDSKKRTVLKNNHIS
jgi:hypothetical protein